MPELPEAQVLSTQLHQAITAQVFRSYTSINPSSIKGDLHRLVGLTIESIDRRAKNIVFHFSGISLIVFLGMTGKIHIHPLSTPPTKHDRVILVFDSCQVSFNDIRKLGKLFVMDTKVDDFFSKWGPEPMSEEFSLDYFEHYITKRKKAIKSLLMDNVFVVGIGNIYACEVLWTSHIHPSREARSLTKIEIEHLLVSIKDTLALSITKGGTSFRDYEHADGSSGGYQSYLSVYRQRICRKCGGMIDKIILAGRGTYYCPSCQK